MPLHEINLIFAQEMIRQLAEELNYHKKEV